jgi:hypothetical protein
MKGRIYTGSLDEGIWVYKIRAESWLIGIRSGTGSVLLPEEWGGYGMIGEGKGIMYFLIPTQ